jgi:hypothetical protein
VTTGIRIPLSWPVVKTPILRNFLATDWNSEFIAPRDLTWRGLGLTLALCQWESPGGYDQIPDPVISGCRD